jgi:hypothetical protein
MIGLPRAKLSATDIALGQQTHEHRCGDRSIGGIEEDIPFVQTSHRAATETPQCQQQADCRERSLPTRHGLGGFVLPGSSDKGTIGIDLLRTLFQHLKVLV